MIDKIFHYGAYVMDAIGIGMIGLLFYGLIIVK